MRTVLTPASRATDPDTSRLAEQHVNVTGKRRRQQELVFDLIKRYPNHTAQELAQYGVLDRYEIGRRVSELETAGAIERSSKSRPCTVTGRAAYTWHPKDPQGRLFA